MKTTTETEKQDMTKRYDAAQMQQFHRLECMLFVAGEPVAVTELARVLCVSTTETRGVLRAMEAAYREEGRGIQLLVTEETAQLISSRVYVEDVKELLQPDEKKSVSQSLMETLSVIAYRQPVTRADVERVRGVRCDYATGQLVKLGLIHEVGRKDTVGRPVLYGTTDRFLRQFGIHSIEEMPEFTRFSKEIAEDAETEEIPI